MYIFNSFIPNKNNFKIQAAENFLNEGEIIKALETLEKIIEENPFDRDALEFLCELNLSLGDWHKAVRPARKLFRLLEEDNPGRYFFLGCTLGRLARFYQASDLLEAAMDLDNSHPDIMRNLGWVKCMSGESEYGKSLLLRSIELDNENIPSYIDLAMIYDLEGDYDNAIEVLEQAGKIDLDNSFILTQRDSLMKQKEYFDLLSNKAKQEYKKAVDNFENIKQRHLYLLLSGMEEKRVDKDDISEVKEEIKRIGLGQVLEDTVEINSHIGKIKMEYLKMHTKFKGRFEKIDKFQIKKIDRELRMSNLDQAKKKEIVFKLAHQGTLESLKILKKHRKNAGGYEDWFNIAISECKMFLKSDILDEPGIIIRKIVS